jgi:hypothetical protein
VDDYTVDPIPLEGGLDTDNSKILTKPGTLQDCLNVEVVDGTGYRRIDGIEKYDGRTTFSGDLTVLSELTFKRVTGTSATEVVDLVPGAALVNDNDPFTQIGVALSVEGSYDADEALWTYTFELWLFDGFTVNGTTDYQVLDGGGDVVDTIVLVAIEYTELSLEAINAYATYLRNEVGELPSGACGLHWFRDRLYAVADNEVIYFLSGGTTPIVAGDYIRTSYNGGVTYAKARVIRSVLLYGTWAGGDAEGFLEIEDQGTVIWAAEGNIISRVASDYTTVLTANAATQESYVSLDDPTEALEYPKGATIWQSRSQAQATAESATVGWSRVDLGVIVEFNNGNIVDGVFPKLDRNTNAPNVEYGTDSTTADTIGAGTVGFTFFGDAAQSVDTEIAALAAGSGIVYTTSSADFVTVLGGAEYATVNGLGFLTIAADSGATTHTNRVGLTNISELSTIPGYAVVTGVEVYIDNITPPTAAAAGNMFETWGVEVSLFKNGATAPLGAPRTFTVTNQDGVATTAGADFVLGDSDDLWGNTALSLEDVKDINFGVSLKATAVITPGANSGPGSTSHGFVIDRIRVKVYYRKQFTRYYFWNGITGAGEERTSADLIAYNVWDGNLAVGTGEGDMQLTNLTAVSGGRTYIEVGDEIHLTAAGTTSATKVGVVTSVDANLLPNKAALDENESKYQFITANFYGDDTWDSFYGVSGAGRAFLFDGTYFAKIYTQEDETKDMPRHLAYHHFHLALGFRSGSVQFSAPGDPENYNGEDGAIELAVGDRITGLQSLRGATLGVFCENSIWGIVGTTRDNFTTQTLAPSTGAIEYTVVDVGVPIYCDARGISTLSQSEKYGDFQGTRLSANITKWLRPRLRRGATNDKGVVGAIAVRSKNQVLYPFKDGIWLCMTLVGGEQAPQFTWRKYIIGASSVTDESEIFVPIAWSSQMDEDGVDRVHLAPDAALSGMTAGNAEFVYELDRGWSFAGNYIPHYFTTNWNYGSSPMAVKILRKILLEGVSRGSAHLVVTTASDWSTSFTTLETQLNLPRTAEDEISPDFVAYSNINSLASRGRVIAIKLAGDPQGATAAAKLAAAEPSHVAQVLILGFTIDGQAVR